MWLIRGGDPGPRENLAGNDRAFSGVALRVGVVRVAICAGLLRGAHRPATRRSRSLRSAIAMRHASHMHDGPIAVVHKRWCCMLKKRALRQGLDLSRSCRIPRVHYLWVCCFNRALAKTSLRSDFHRAITARRSAEPCHVSTADSSALARRPALAEPPCDTPAAGVASIAQGGV